MSFGNKKYKRLKLTQIRPEGWLYRQLSIQMNGLSGKLYDIWDSVGSYCGWLGGTGDDWERAPYYLDGLLSLAYYLQDEEQMALCRRFAEWTLDSQGEDGNFGPFSSKGDYWSRFVMLKVLVQFEEITGDERILPFFKHYFEYLDGAMDLHPMDGWTSARTAELLYCFKWYWEKTGEPGWESFLAKVESQSLDWTDLFADFPFTRPTAFYYNWEELTKGSRERIDKIMKFHATHIVNVTMGLKYPAMQYYFGEKESCAAIARNAIEVLRRYHGVASGAVNGDEHLSGNSPTQGAELCSIVEYMFSLQNMLEILGDTEFADMLERLAYNALPSTMTEDCMGHQYLQQANQVLVSKSRRNWFNNDDTSNMYGLEPHYGCCTANMHQGWPKFVDSLWYQEGDDCLVSMVLAPGTVTASLGGEEVCIQLSTEYPFENTLIYEIKKAPQKGMSLKIRIPGWCSQPEVRGEIYGKISAEVCGNEKYAVVDKKKSMIEIRRQFCVGEKITVTCPMDVIYTSWYKDSLAVERGPLVYGLNIKESWSVYKESAGVKDYTVAPQSPWNYAVKKDGLTEVEVNPVTETPFSKAHPPVIVRARACRLDEWVIENDSAGEMPASPVCKGWEEEGIELIPFGCTRLRVSQFPYFL